MLDLDQALKLKPDNADALLARGMALIKKREHTRALADLDKAIALGASKIESHVARADIYEAQGKGELAIADLRRAMEAPPRNFIEILAQANKKRIDELGKRNPCGSAGRGSGVDTCL